MQLDLEAKTKNKIQYRLKGFLLTFINLNLLSLAQSPLNQLL